MSKKMKQPQKPAAPQMIDAVVAPKKVKNPPPAPKTIDPKEKVKNPPPPPDMIDAVAVWSAEAVVAADNDLRELRLGTSEVMFVPFTWSLGKATVHYLDWPTVRGYILCNGEGCVACAAGRKKDLRHLLPVYSVADRAVAVLPVAPDQRPGAIRPQLLPILVRVESGERLLVTALKEGVRYSITASRLPEKADDGAGAVLTFKKALGEGDVDLASVYRCISNEEIASIPEVVAILEMKGLM